MERRGMFFNGQSEHEFVFLFFLLNTKLKKDPQKSTKSKGLAKGPQQEDFMGSQRQAATDGKRFTSVFKFNLYYFVHLLLTL